MRRSSRRYFGQKLRQVNEDRGVVIETRGRDQSQGQVQQRSQRGDDVGVITVAKRVGRGMLGSIKKPHCIIWNQQAVGMRGGGSRWGGERAGKGRRKWGGVRKKEAGEGGVRRSGVGYEY